jgi:hypothetical protein
MAQRRGGVPLIRTGLLLVVGAVAVSMFELYAGFGGLASDMHSAEPIPENWRELRSFFLERFLFRSAASTAIFWAGLALIGAGAARGVLRIGRGRAGLQ